MKTDLGKNGEKIKEVYICLDISSY